MALCQLCSVAESRYKCPTCLIPYCSLACYKPHKTEHEASAPAPAEPPPSTASTTTATSTATSTTTTTTTEPASGAPPPVKSIPPPSATIAITTPSSDPPSAYAPLLTHPTLLSHLRSTSSLHSLLYQIYLTTLELPPKQTTTPPNPYKISKNPQKKHIWTPAVGVAKAVKRLSKIREQGLAEGGDGGPLEEFVGMVVGCIGDGTGGKAGEMVVGL